MKTSVNECMKYYEEELKEGNYTYHGFSGMLPDRHIGQINKVVADISDDGICSDIVIYTVGAAMKNDHYYGGGIDITEPVVEFLKGQLEWDEMVQEICDLLEES